MPLAAAAFFLSFGNQEDGPRRWCAYRTQKEATQAAGADELAAETAEMRWQGATVTRLVDTTESEDSIVVDTYHFDSTGRVVLLERRGKYANDPPATAVFTPDAQASWFRAIPARKHSAN